MPSLIAGLADPLRVLLFTAGGAALAWVGVKQGWWLSVILVVAILGVSLLVQAVGESKVTTDPMRALTLMETRAASIGVLTAAAGALGIVLTVELASGDAEGFDKELASTVSAALVAFVSAVTLTADKTDAAVGKYIQGVFQSKHARDDRATEGQVALEKGSDAHLAIMSSAAFGLTDWTSENRRTRIKYLTGEMGSGGNLGRVTRNGAVKAT